MRISTLILASMLATGCSIYKKFSLPQAVETVYAKSTVDYTDKDDPADIISSAIIKAKQNAIKQIVEVFVEESVMEQRRKEVDKYLLYEPDYFIHDYKIIREDFYASSYAMEMKAYLKIDAIIEKLNYLNLTGKKRPKKVVIYPSISSQINFSSDPWLKQITSKLAENLYAASLLTSKNQILASETVIEKAQMSGADYVMIADIAVNKLVQGSQFISGFYPYRASMELSIYSARKSKLIAKISKQAGGFETSPRASVETSVAKATKLIMEELSFPFEKSASLQNPISCTVKLLDTLPKIKKFYDTLLDMDVICDFSVTGYKKGGEVTFQLYSENASGQEFAALLIRQKPFALTVEEISKYKVVLSAQ